MRCINLKVKTSSAGVSGIFPDFANDAERQLELRARTVLAYGYEHGAIKPYVEEVDNISNLVLLDAAQSDKLEASEIAWPIKHPIHTGCIYVPIDVNAGWRDQPGRLLLYVDKSMNVDVALRRYFQASLRFLNDNRYVATILGEFFTKANP